MCKECKDCWNYKVSEIGCYDSDKPCKYYTSEDKDEVMVMVNQYEKENIE